MSESTFARVYTETKKSRSVKIIIAVQTLLTTVLANAWLPYTVYSLRAWIPLGILLLLIANLLPLILLFRLPRVRLALCRHGVCCLYAFLWSLCASVVIQNVVLCRYLVENPTLCLFSALLCTVVEAILFWNGMITVYCASVQLGVRHRLIGLLCGFIPIANIVMLCLIIGKVNEEVAFETAVIASDEERASDAICRTKYPILLVHGVFFRDSHILNYWGRIPDALAKNGAMLFYGNQNSAAAVADSAAALAERIRDVLRTTGAEKVNVIAHSKGGLDMRYAIAHCGAAPYVASLTTVNTPHRGCGFADYLLHKVSPKVQAAIEKTYNAAASKMGDKNPDFMAAVRDLGAEICIPRDTEMPAPDGIFCRSVGSRLAHATGGTFPLYFSYPLVRHFDGANDGLVAESSFRFGEDYVFITPKGTRGISHADMIDLNRENIPGFDVREFYVFLVNDLRERGY